MTHIISPKITQRQRNFIIGTILGGSSIVKPGKGVNSYLSMRSKDINWLRYKATELKDLASRDPITIEKTNRWHSICYPLFNEFRDMFYDGDDRILHMDHLNMLQDVAIMVWYTDCGKLHKKHVILNTQVWGEKGSNTICEYFSYLGYKSEPMKERNNYRVKLDEESSKKFMSMISPHVPPLYHCVNS